MCGIAGYVGRASRFSDAQLKQMLAAIEHRGPDDSGTYTAGLRADEDARVWLGSRRLAIQDLSPAGHQPMVDAATGNAIAFNGEIYNFLELRADLQKNGYPFSSRCDTEVALASWCAKGVSAVDDWRGMFGAAVWDRAKEELWLVRDHWGVKPLYYWTDQNSVLFCSEVRGLLASGMIPRKLSRQGVEDFLRFGALQDPVTIVDGVYALLPGQLLRWSGGQVEIRRYMELPGREAPEPGKDIATILRESVQGQLISDVPVVVFLSGGVDSSVVSLLARQVGGSAINTMSLIFEESRYSERDYARRVARHIGTTHHEVLVKGDEVQAKARAAISQMDQPSMDAINNYLVSGAARQAGFTVALSGLGGDEFFGGYATFRRTRILDAALRYARLAPRASRLASKALQLGLTPRDGAAIKLRQFLVHGDLDEHPYFLQRTTFFPSQIQRLLRISPPCSIDLQQKVRMREQYLHEETDGLDSLNQISLLEARTYMGNMLLRDSDQMSMAHSLELRVPFVDQVLAAHVLSIPSDRKGFGKTPKMLLRRAFAPQLPEEVFSRRKMGFTLPWPEWLRGPLASEVATVLQKDTGELWQGDARLQVWEEFRRGRLDWSRPWSLYVLSRWIMQNIVGQGEGLREDRAAANPRMTVPHV